MSVMDFVIALFFASITCVIVYLAIKLQKARADDEIKTIKLTDDQIEKDINSIDLSTLVNRNNSEGDGSGGKGGSA